MDGSTVIILAIIGAFLWWLFSKTDATDNQKKVVTYVDPNTGQQTKVAREKRKPQNRLDIEKPNPFEITPEIAQVLETLEKTNTNVFLTGKAGTGKSTLLRYFRATTNKCPVVVAPTGVAAVNVQGQTIHNFFRFGIDITLDRVRRVSYEKGQIYRHMKMLIIDEISMARADLFECIDKFLRLNTGKINLPFGGVQIVAIGDLYQLPPIVINSEKAFFERVYDSPFFFSTEAYKNGNFKKFELNTVYRQTDQSFIRALNAIREGVPTEEHINLLNTRVIAGSTGDLDDHVHLVTTNKMAKEINDARMTRLTTKPITYKATMFGTFPEKNAPTDVELTLKVGTKIMLLNNDREHRWVNGDLAKVLETKPDSITVEFDDNTIDDVGVYTWETIRFVFDEEEQKIIPTKIGGFTQLPVKPAWAMTIHKAQGKTFEKTFIDLGSGAFAEGQTYVALSRCKGLEGLKLASPLMLQDVFVNKKVKDFMSFSHGDKGPTSRDEVVRPNQPIRSHKQSNPKAKNIERETVIPSEKLSKEEFVLQAIKKLRTGNYKGIHAVYSGFNEAFREYFNEDPIKATEELEKKGIISLKPVKGGVILYDAKEVESKRGKSSKALGKILDS